MTQDELRQKLGAPIGDAEDAGLGLPEMIAVLEDQAEAMQIAYEE